MPLTAARVRELLDYDPSTGELRWKVDRGRYARAGHRAGRIQTDRRSGRQFRRVGVDRGLYIATRVIFLMMEGRWPSGEIDHRDGDSLNDRWDNLREATVLQNRQNVRRSRKARPGLKGTRPNRHRFEANINVAGKRIYLGIFDTAQEAHAAYCAASVKYHGEFGRTS